MVWFIFALSGIEISIAFYTLTKDIINSTQSQFVHKDHQIVYFVTYLAISLLFKLTIIAKAQQNLTEIERDKKDASYIISSEDLSCHVFIFGQIPLVFITMCVLSMLLKMRLFKASITLNMM